MNLVAIGGHDLDPAAGGFSAVAWPPELATLQERLRRASENARGDGPGPGGAFHPVEAEAAAIQTRYERFTLGVMLIGAVVAAVLAMRIISSLDRSLATVTATANDSIGCAVTYRWSAPTGTLAQPAERSTVWTAPQQTGTVPVTYCHHSSTPRFFAAAPISSW